MSCMNEQLFHHRDIIDSFYYTTAYREFIQTKGTQNIILSIVSQKHVVYLPHTPDIKQETFTLRKKNKITMKSEKWHPCHSILPLISSPLFLHTSPISFFFWFSPFFLSISPEYKEWEQWQGSFDFFSLDVVRKWLFEKKIPDSFFQRMRHNICYAFYTFFYNITNFTIIYFTNPVPFSSVIFFFKWNKLTMSTSFFFLFDDNKNGVT